MKAPASITILYLIFLDQRNATQKTRPKEIIANATKQLQQ